RDTRLGAAPAADIARTDSAERRDHPEIGGRAQSGDDPAAKRPDRTTAAGAGIAAGGRAAASPSDPSSHPAAAAPASAGQVGTAPHTNRLLRTAAATKLVNSGCGSSGRDFNSG